MVQFMQGKQNISLELSGTVAQVYFKTGSMVQFMQAKQNISLELSE
jgi:hypothetical protein